MISIGTPLATSATKILLLGSGELGKEVAISAQRLGVEVIAVDRYPNAPAMQVAHRSYVISMLDKDALINIINKERPHFIVPEIEAIATDALVELEQKGFNVVPNAKATKLTMDREGIRKLVAEKLCINTSPFRFASTYAEYVQAVDEIGFPCVIKPVMSSSGKGQSTVQNKNDVQSAWDNALTNARGGSLRVIVEGFVHFDYEITLLTVRCSEGTCFCAPIGHRQVKGDYHESWQPHPMSDAVLEKCQAIAKEVTDELGGYGLFGVELFIKGDAVYFSEVSPRPHDTGMVTLISQSLTEFDLHVRAFLGLPIPNIRLWRPAASHVIIGRGDSNNMIYHHIEKALAMEDTHLRLFGKPEMKGERRLGVALALADTIEQAKQKAANAAAMIQVE